MLRLKSSCEMLLSNVDCNGVDCDSFFGVEVDCNGFTVVDVHDENAPLKLVLLVTNDPVLESNRNEKISYYFPI